MNSEKRGFLYINRFTRTHQFHTHIKWLTRDEKESRRGLSVNAEMKSEEELEFGGGESVSDGCVLVRERVEFFYYCSILSGFFL